jgi:hypothetical protein
VRRSHGALAAHSPVMPRPAKSSRIPAPRPEPPQLELFPEPVLIEALEPQRVGGSRTRVLGVWRVRYGSEPRGHRVFHDRHGWYCEEHGAECRAARTAQGAEVPARVEPDAPATKPARTRRARG